MEFNLSGIQPKAEKSNNIEKLVIIGSGPAGLSAALYAARAELQPLVISGVELGGQVSLTHVIENYPGFPEGVGGSQLGDLIQKQAERFGARVEFDTAMSVDLSSRPFTIKTYGKEYKAQALIVATGASPFHLNVPGEKELTGRGVSYCATCDGWFFKEKNVAVVGGGDSAVEEAIFLTKFASTVTIIHRRDELRAGAILQKRAKENPKIKFLWNTTIKEIHGEGALKSLLVTDVKTGQDSTLQADGVFIFIGHKPNTELFQGQLVMDSNGYIESNRLMETSVPGVFAAGEATDPVYRQVVTSAGMGAAAAMMAGKFLEEMEQG
jgi:thioredoxin reductase (NADPH)